MKFLVFCPSLVSFSRYDIGYTSPRYRWAKYCDQRVCVSDSLFVGVYVHWHISKTTRPNFTNFFPACFLHVAVARSFSDDSAICYVLPVCG